MSPHSIKNPVTGISLKSEPAIGGDSISVARPSRPWYRRAALVSSAGVLAVVIALLVFANKRAKNSSATSTTASTRSSAAMASMPGMTPATAGSVLITPEQIRQFGITFGLVQMRPLEYQVRTAGIVAVNESRLAKVTPKFSGYVEHLYVNFAGQAVRRGQPLAAIFSPDLVAAEQELLLARRLSRTIGGSSVPGVPGTSTDLLSAAKERLRLWDVSESQMNEVLSSGRPIRTVTLFSPASGVVLDKKVVQGQAVQAGEELYTIADLSDVWVEAQLREEEAGHVAVGAAATVELASYPGRLVGGRVTYLYPTLAEQARTVKARITIPNADGRLKPGMFATVNFTTPSRLALTVPRSALVQTGERTLVFVDVGNGQLTPHDVEVGRTVGDNAEVLSGVSAGQRVVTSAQFLLDSESNLVEVMKSMIGNMGSGDKAMKNMPGMDMSTDKGADTKNMPGMKMPSGR